MSGQWVGFLRAAAVAGLLLSQSISLTARTADLGRSGSMLGRARPFAVLSQSGVSNNGRSIVYGDVGAVGSEGVSGFPPGAVFAGSVHRSDPSVRDAQMDAFTAYRRLMNLKSVSIESATEGNLGGLTLTPGIYALDNSARVNGILRLDTLGKEHAVFVFQIGGNLATTRDAAVIVDRGGLGEAVYWQVEGSVRLGKGTHFTGNILALNDVAADNDARIRCGRIFALTGTVVMDNDSISTACESRELPVQGIARGFMGGVLNSSPSSGPGTVNSTPEPGTFWLAGSCLAAYIAFVLLHRRSRQN
jgi:hypothetical protein